MFYNGSMKENLNCKTICPLKQKVQTTRITYQNRWNIVVSSGSLWTDERWFPIDKALQKAGDHSKVCHDWEIFKLLFLLHNVYPVWIYEDIKNDKDYNRV